jgi:hypothetical protein
MHQRNGPDANKIAAVSESRTIARRYAPTTSWPSPGTSIESVAAATDPV